MKKKSLLFLLIGLFCIQYVFADPMELSLTLKRENPNSTNPDKGHRTPPLTPSLYIEDGTLSFSTSCLGYTLELVRDGEVEFTYIITTTDDLVLPSTLSGEYQLLLVGPSFTFEGIVEL